MHIISRDKCNWLRERIEQFKVEPLPPAKKKQILDRLCYADTFERFLAHKFNTAKRFGLEGAESLIPGMKAMVDRVTELGVNGVVFGMPHRGRLNVLVNVIRKPMEVLLKEFQGTHIDLQRYNERIANGGAGGDWSGSGDVKYHLGTSYDRQYPDGRKVHLALVANPSHLEAVNPVVVGKVKAKQDMSGDDDKTKTMGVLLHGDAAFAGQGIVYETFLLSQLKNYGTGGTVHIVVNNQVGFTTDPESSRSTLHCTDLGKAFDVPIFHVNADDPEAVTRVFELAGEYRQHFKSDVIIDLVGYRRHGHNELDQPSFTQPLMYGSIAKHPSALDMYEKKLVAEGSITAAEAAAIRKAADDTYQAAWEESKKKEPSKENWLTSRWKGFNSPEQISKIRPTGVSSDQLKMIGEKLTALPAGFRVHSSLTRILKAKEDMIKSGSGVDWATAEALAFGSLLLEGNRVRLSGQDVERGTFSHRHVVLHDQVTNSTYCPLSHLDSKQAPFLATNSPLSEFGVMGFELGYAMEDPNQLTLWEAQFGDFVNGAQIIIDQFLSAGETKWFRQCGLTLLLPHGFEGQGPEHSSARVERFLQAVDDQENVVPPMAEELRMQIQHTNMQVVNCSTPANYFHVLRRQVHRNFRKPLIVITPKSLLRHKSAVSSLTEMAESSTFQRLIPDTHTSLAPAKKVRKLIFCTGKIYYELEKARAESGGKHDDVAIARVEQIAPFPFDLVAAEAKKYPNAQIVWCQEEPRNMGAWFYVAPRIETATKTLLGKELRPVS
jgi:2-oxoglutarate dehydrogenase E1 component